MKLPPTTNPCVLPPLLRATLRFLPTAYEPGFEVRTAYDVQNRRAVTLPSTFGLPDELWPQRRDEDARKVFAAGSRFLIPCLVRQFTPMHDGWKRDPEQVYLYSAPSVVARMICEQIAGKLREVPAWEDAEEGGMTRTEWERLCDLADTDPWLDEPVDLFSLTKGADVQIERLGEGIRTEFHIEFGPPSLAVEPEDLDVLRSLDFDPADYVTFNPRRYDALVHALQEVRA